MHSSRTQTTFAVVMSNGAESGGPREERVPVPSAPYMVLGLNIMLFNEQQYIMLLFYDSILCYTFCLVYMYGGDVLVR